MRVLGFVLALLAWTLVAQVALADEHARWQKLENNPACVVWNPYPVEQETVTWSGTCANGKAQGRGTAVWRYLEDGEWKEERYEGDFKDGKRDGRGKSTGEYGVYEGDWKDSKANGRGVWVEANGDRYEGEFKDDKFHGHGVMEWGPDTDWAGDRYEGEWEDDMMHGRGVYVWGLYSKWAGDRYEGDYKDGKRHGRGTYNDADGKECEGDWKDGRLLGEGRGWRNGRQMKCYLDGNTFHFTD